MDGEAGARLAVTGVYDIIVLDRLLPYRDGLSVLNEIRRYGFETPVMFLTSKKSPMDLVEVLDSGADDYLSKPFSTEEFLARLRALAREKQGPDGQYSQNNRNLTGSHEAASNYKK